MIKATEFEENAYKKIIVYLYGAKFCLKEMEH